jgi:hypothetical protein
MSAKLELERVRRLLPAAWRHRAAVIWGLYAAGILVILLLPLMSSSGYLDEKALLLGVLPSTWKSGAPAAAGLARRIAAAGPHPSLAALLSAADAGAEGQPHLAWHPIASPGCESVYAVVPAARGDGTESLGLVLPIDLRDASAAALGAAVGVSAARQLAAAPWLAKDVAVAFVDAGRCGGALAATEAWLAALEAGGGPGPGAPPLGLLQQALVVDVASVAATEARLGVVGHSGQLPNMDMLFLTKRNLDYFTGLPAGLDVGGAPAHHAQRAPTGAAAWMEQAATGLAFAARLAGGRPSGAHAALLRRGVDAVTVTLRRGAGEGGGGGNPAALEQTAQFGLTAAEMVLHTCNNLEERLHHSAALYALVSADRYASVGACMAAPACLLLAALLQAAGRLAAARGAPAARWRAAWARAVGAHAAAGAAVATWQGAGLEGAATAAAVIVGGAYCLVEWGQAWADVVAEGRPPAAAPPPPAAEARSPAALAALLGALLVAEAAALLLWRWALSLAVLLLAVPALQLLPGPR